MNPLVFIALGIGLYFYSKQSQATTQKVTFMPLHIKAAGSSLIKKLEGFSSTIYNDQAGIPTIGWGHKLLSGEAEKFKDGISRQTAEELLAEDMRYATNAVKYYVTVPLNQNQYDALVSFVYNIGAQAFANSTLLKELNKGNYEEVGNQLKRWKYITVNGKKIVSNGLVNRRQSEEKLFYA